MVNYSKIRKHILHTFFCLALFISGCGYTLQTKTDLPFDTISIGRIENLTHEPKLQDRMNRLLAKTLMERGFQINQSARHRIEGNITKFTLTALSEKDLIASEYEVTIIGDFRLIDKEKNSTLDLHTSSPFITYFSTAGPLENLTAQKEAATDIALKNIAEELIRRITYSSLTPASPKTGSKK